MGDVAVRKVIDGASGDVDVCEGGGDAAGSVGVERMPDVFSVDVAVVADIGGIEERNNASEGISYVNTIISKVYSWNIHLKPYFYNLMLLPSLWIFVESTEERNSASGGERFVNT